MKLQKPSKILTAKVPNWMRNLSIIFLILSIIILAVVLIVHFAPIGFLTRFRGLYWFI